MFYSEFRTFLKLKYPVYESDQESWSRYEEIYRLTTKLAEKCQAKPNRCLALEESWKNIAVFWSCYSIDLCGSDLMFESLYHICFRKFSEKAKDPTLMRLILLIEDELLSFSYAFKVWLQTDFFQKAYNEITAPRWENKTFKKVYEDEFYMYLTYRVTRMVMMKNLSRDKWTGLFGDFDYRYHCGLSQIYSYVDDYEAAVEFLIPDAYSWYEEWSDISVMVACIKVLYGVDFSGDIRGLEALIKATKHRQDIVTCARYLYRLKTCPITLLQHLWGDEYAQKLQVGFLSLCKRHKAAKFRGNRSRYAYAKFLNHWIYKQIGTWRRDKTVELSDKLVETWFNIALGI